MQNNKNDYLWNTVGVFAQNVVSPLLLVVVTRVNGVEASGLISFAFAIAIVAWGIGTWGGRTYQVSDFAGKYKAQSYVVARILLGAAIIAVTLLFCALNAYDIYKTALILSLVSFKVIESVADSLFGILQVHGKLAVTGKSLLIKAILGITLFLIIDKLSGNLFLSSIGFVLANLLIIFAYDLLYVRRVLGTIIVRTKLKAYYFEAKSIIKRCAPIAVIIFLSLFSLNIPRYFLDKYHPDQLAYFGILAMPITALALFITFILQPNITTFSNHMRDAEYKHFDLLVRKIFIYSLIGSIALLVVTWFIGTPLLHIIFNLDFLEYKSALMILIVGAIFNAYVSICVNIFIILRRFSVPFYVLVTTNCILALLCIPGVNQYGLTGGMGLFALINLVQAIVLVVYYSRTLRQLQKVQYTN